MADQKEPLLTTNGLVGTATWTFDIDSGYIHDNTQIVAGSLGLIDPLEDGVCTFPVLETPKVHGYSAIKYNTSVSTVTGAPVMWMKSNYSPTYEALPTDMSDISVRSNKITLQAAIPAGANSIESVLVTYAIAFNSTADIDTMSDLSNETTTGKQFTTEEKESAIQLANSKMLYVLKDWDDFFSDKVDFQVRSMLKEAEANYALGILFEKKSKQYINIEGDDDFSVADINVNPEAGSQKDFFAVYQVLADRYNLKADEIMSMVTPPGTDSIRSTFFFSVSSAKYAKPVGKTLKQSKPCIPYTPLTDTLLNAHINNISNPHKVTAIQIGLGNVTNDAQLLRAAGDFAVFTAKAVPADSDIILIEDSADTGIKKYITIGSIAGGSGITIWTTLTRPAVTSAGITGFNTDFMGMETSISTFYAPFTYSWLVIRGRWDYDHQPTDVAAGSKGYNSDIMQDELWNGSKWVLNA